MDRYEKLSRHWVEKTFIEKHGLFLHALTYRLEKAKEEALFLQNIFNENEVPRDGKVLDLACGIGRHSISLTELRYKVTGIDISEPYIEYAKTLAEERGVADRCEFIVGDMRELKKALCGRTGFDAVISMFTSLGYYERETDVLVLNQAREVTKDGGVMVIDMMNKDYLFRHLEPQRYHEVPRELVQLEETTIDHESSRMKSSWRIYVPEGDDLRYKGLIEFDNLVYNADELKEITKLSGWTPIRLYGGFKGAAFSEGMKRIILVARSR
ncbi:MAG: class I SAM-dependent methyltransferase [Candidatus Bathyarchaeota archaeon]|nr:class I SAM-dependent methyltransferase [Candidatus Bathyarchaeota archaeon]